MEPYVTCQECGADLVEGEEDLCSDCENGYEDEDDDEEDEE